MAHLTQFGTKPPELHARPWRQLVLERLRLSGSPTVKLAMYLIRNYEPHTNVNYATATLAREVTIGLNLAQLPDDDILHEAASIVRPYMNSRLHDIGSPDAYMDVKIHYFHLGSTGQGPLEATRYLGFQRIDSLPAPWPQRSAPMMVYALFSSALNPKSPQQRAIPYFRDTLVPTTERMRSLVRATHNASAVAWPEDYTLPSTWPAMQNVLVPNMRYIKAHRALSTLTLQDIKWSHLFPAHPSLIGPGELLALLQAPSTDRPRVCILFAHSGADPLGSPLEWVPFTSHLNERSTIAYAFDADQAYREGFDSTLYGRNHLDYIIAIPLRALRRYDAWRKEQGLDSFESPGVKVMVKSARIQHDHAVRLHEILLRIALKRMTGAGAHEGTARRPGDALPYGYEF
ncbi:hypothetical protein K466DRAFT_495608 [Polyporus arcularius HHB13444]|uniref:Uncharacterized protein n=1 Tax=Polyporus arcularius HHB13444 TaxID=1314778 RepID=A0A5C3P8U2_9APHY|nr:hypothetical protein K466DRAFT_495608 [Polyporus arcularius HHB13444]